MSQTTEINLKFEELLTPTDSLLEDALITVRLIHHIGVLSRGLLKIVTVIASHIV